MHYDSNVIIMLLNNSNPPPLQAPALIILNLSEILQYLIRRKMKTQNSVAKEADVQCNFYVNCVMILPTKPVIFNKNSLVLNRYYYMQIRQTWI